jgi:hypothetical protein
MYTKWKWPSREQWACNRVTEARPIDDAAWEKELERRRRLDDDATHPERRGILRNQPVVYSNAEVRGKLRAWKTRLHKDYQAFSAVFYSSAPRKACIDLVKRGSRTGRQRAVDKLGQAPESRTTEPRTTTAHYPTKP